MASEESVIGRSTRRIEGRDKVTGSTAYVGDVHPRASAYARLVLSPYARARIRSVDTAEAREAPGVIGVYTERDLSARDLLAKDEVFYAGEAVAVVVARDPASAQDAAELVRVEWEELPAVVDAEAAMRPDSPLTRPEPADREGEGAAAHGAATESGAEAEEKPRNVNSMAHFTRGDVESAFSMADVVIEDTYRLAAVHQGYIETHGSVAEAAHSGSMTIWTSTQGHFFVRRNTAQQLGLPDHVVNVIPMTVGGGFGGKIVLLEALVGELSRTVGRPVVMVLDRDQDFMISNPAPAAVIKLKMGATKAGEVTALKAEMIWDAGAAGGAPVGIAALFLGGTYRIPNLDVRGYEVLTNKTPNGAYRAPGAPQAYFALECHMNRLAAALGQDPIEFRIQHAAREGDELPNGRPLPRIGLIECLERVRDHPLWQNRTAQPGEGIAVAAGGWMGGVEPAAAACRVNGDGSLTLQVGAVDITGVNTTFALIAAEVFGMDPAQVQVVPGDTDHAPYTGMSGGSKITYSVGPAVKAAVEDARRQLLEMAADKMEISVDDLELRGGTVSVKGSPTHMIEVAALARESMQFGGKYAPINGFGRTAITNQSPGFAAHLCRVRVDEVTGQVQVLDYVAAQDVGRALNPAEVIGQISGGVVQGIGRALYERMTYDERGQLIDGSFADYALPLANDVPTIDVQIVEVPSPHGPFGAKGVGEPPVIPVPAAVASAVEAATGVNMSQVPLTPEVIVTTVARAREEQTQAAD